MNLWIALLITTLLTGHLALAANTPSQQQPGIRFEIGYLFSSAEGCFTELELDMKLNLNAPESSFVNATVATPSLEMGSEMMENYVKAKDFFDVERYPTMSFALQSLVPQAEGYMATGTLRIKGIENTVAIPFRMEPLADGSHVLSGSFTIDRTDFGIGGSMVGLDNHVTIHLLLPVPTEAASATTNH